MGGWGVRGPLKQKKQRGGWGVATHPAPDSWREEGKQLPLVSLLLYLSSSSFVYVTICFDATSVIVIAVAVVIQVVIKVVVADVVKQIVTTELQL